ncbi:hypothetical protein [Paenibacillus daejeonensis]|uniref:hypothetical protein n=1 Tax=Paenibacillus daejeonensis TaxID=135193 RepID=UPI00037A6BBE|nr:hypothetical protein [Paenibacillus daejeonensis]
MKKKWELTHKGLTIRVENSWWLGEKLYVDNELQDENVGLSLRGRLIGNVNLGEGQKEMIKVSLGGWFSIKIRMFIEDRQVFPMRA